MQQLELRYFFPLTEQVPLDLDYEPSIAYSKQLQEERWKYSVNTGTGILVGNGGTWTTTATTNASRLSSFTINVDAMPITIVSKKKPNFISKIIYKSMGMNWKVA